MGEKTTKNMTHWREFHETDYLGSHDLVAEGLEEMILKITKAERQTVKDQNGKDESCLVCFFEGAKPMILNATNCKSIEKVAKTPFIEKWKDNHVTVYIERGIIAFGKTVDGLRIRQFAPSIKVDDKDIEADIKKLSECKDMSELKIVYTKLTNRNHPKVVAKKEDLKAEFLK